MTADQRRGVFTTTIRDPLTGQPFPNNTIPANRIDPVAANIMNLVPLPNTTGAQQLHPPAQRRGRIGSLPGARRHADRQRQQPVRPLHRQQPRPLRAGLVWRRARRHLDVGLGPELPRLARGGRRLEQGARLEPGQRVARVVRPRHQRRQPGSVRPERHGADRLQGRAGRSARRRRHCRHRHRRPHSSRLAELHAEVPAHQPGAVDEHHHLDARQAPAQVRRRPDDADEQRVLRRGADARQPALPGDVHRQRLCRLPDRLSESRRADQRVRGRRRSCGRARSTCRTTGSRPTS